MKSNDIKNGSNNDVTAINEDDQMLPNINNKSTIENIDTTTNKETSCGLWFLQGPCLQKFANKKAYVFLYGLLGCTFSAAYAYFNGTITTLEKRFKLPSRTTGK